MTALYTCSEQPFCHCSAAAGFSARIISRVDTAISVVSVFVRRADLRITAQNA